MEVPLAQVLARRVEDDPGDTAGGVFTLSDAGFTLTLELFWYPLLEGAAAGQGSGLGALGLQHLARQLQGGVQTADMLLPGMRSERSAAAAAAEAVAAALAPPAGAGQSWL